MRKFLAYCLAWVFVLMLAPLSASAADSFDPCGTYALEQCSFGEPSDDKATKPDRKVAKEKFWTEADRAAFGATLSSVSENHTRLLAFATRHHHIKWRRVLEFSKSNIVAETIHSSVYSSVYFPDSFFNLKLQDRVTVILHELAHVVDDDARYSLSKEWCRIVAPRIAKFKQIYGTGIAELSDSEVRRANSIARTCGLPRAYAAEGLAEAFACFVESLGFNIKDTEVEGFFSRTFPLLDVDSYDQFEDKLSEQDHLEDLLCDARNYLAQGRDQEAMKCYSVVVGEENPLPSIYGSIGGLWTKRGEYELARNAFQREISRLNELVVPQGCKEYDCAAINLAIAELRYRLQSQGSLNTCTKGDVCYGTP